jgi:hypothetical protein
MVVLAKRTSFWSCTRGELRLFSRVKQLANCTVREVHHALHGKFSELTLRLLCLPMLWLCSNCTVREVHHALHGKFSELKLRLLCLPMLWLCFRLPHAIAALNYLRRKRIPQITPKPKANRAPALHLIVCFLDCSVCFLNCSSNFKTA